MVQALDLVVQRRLQRRVAMAEQRRLAPEPALSQPMGRPTKRDRRTLKDWGNRWSASVDDERD